jgi:hypothetical protein
MGSSAELILVSAEKIRRNSVKTVSEITEGPAKGFKVTTPEPGDKVPMAGDAAHLKKIKLHYLDGHVPPSPAETMAQKPVMLSLGGVSLPVQVPPADKRKVIGHGRINGVVKTFYAEEKK